MQKPFKFRYVNEIAGAFVLVMVLLLVSGLAISGQIQGWFEPRRTFEVVLPSEGTMGIRAGSEVHVVGSKAGTVRRVELRDQSDQRLHDIRLADPNQIHMVAILEVRSDRVAFIGEDSKAILKHDLGGFGAPYFEISRGSKRRETDNLRLALEYEKDVKDGLTAAVDRISAAVVPAVEEIKVSTHKIGLVADSLSSPDGNLQGLLTNLDSILTSVDEGQSPAGILFKDKESGGKLKDAIASFNSATKEMELMLEEVGKITTKVQQGEGAAGALLADAEVEETLRQSLASIESATAEIDKTLGSMPELLGNANTVLGNANTVIGTTNTAIVEYNQAAIDLQDALDEYEILAEGMQNHWLVRSPVGKVKEERDRSEQVLSNTRSVSLTGSNSSSSRSSSTPVKATPLKRSSSSSEKKGIRLPFFNRKKN